MVAFQARVLGMGLLCLCAVACKPNTEGGASLIGAPRILALRAEPAEAVPGSQVAWSALFVSSAGDADPNLLSWAFCEERKPIAVSGPVALDCLAPSADALAAIGSGASVAGTLPADGCRVFGPNPPAPKMGEPVARPADPDSTGGYYQPVRVRIALASGDEYAVALTRISCGLANASSDQTIDFSKRYRLNENPALDSVLLDPDGAAMPLSEDANAPSVVQAGAHLTLRASWADCPLSAVCGDGICGAGETKDNCSDDCKDPHGCSGSEPYVDLDPVSHAIVERRESMLVSWFATDGSFEHDRSGLAESQADTPASDNAWSAPAAGGDVRMWVVLRDDRGGVGYRSFYLHAD